MVTTTYHLFGAKGGAGTSTVASALALTLSRKDKTTLSAGYGNPNDDDLLAILGSAHGIERKIGSEITPDLFWRQPESDDPTFRVIDHGTDLEWAAETAAFRSPDHRVVRLLVTRGCYLAMRRVVHSPGIKHIDGIVLLEEPERALGKREVQDVTGRPVIARIPVKPFVARAIDAGVLSLKVPDDLARGIDVIIKWSKEIPLLASV